MIANPFWDILNNNTQIYYPLTKKFCLEISPYTADDDRNLNYSNDHITITNTDVDLLNAINYRSLITQHELIISANEESLKVVCDISKAKQAQ